MTDFISKDADVVRFNFRLINKEGFLSNDNAKLKDASFNITLNKVLLNQSENFYIEVEKYKIPGTYLPNQIFRIQQGIGQTNPNLGTYAITLRFAGVDYTVFLLLVPDDKTIPVPNAPSANNGLQAKSEYYFIFTYESFLKLLNTALATSFALIQAAGGLPGNVSSPPIFQYNKFGAIFSFMVQGSYIAAGVQLFFNANLYDLFTTFESFKVNDPLNISKNYEIIIRFQGDNIVPFTPIGGPINTVDWLKIIQVGSSIEFFDSASRIILETNLPAGNEYSSGNELKIPGPGLLVAETVLIDSIIQSIVRTGRGYITFFETSARINGLTGGSIQHISLNARWFDRKGEDYPIRIGPYQEIEVTIVFLRKNLKKNITIEDFINSDLAIVRV
ncbi:hypothetical protein LCGC14_0704730 [marine sediment metagenome]|uniref:Minor capsid protein V18-like jelly roll domain-containing protein n=1 Tax=marine sediment metagenome TaxID=412755 RepID=A0A0F9T2S9_9ZZZZ|nr:hypothetical protein [archaeon]